MQQDSFHKSVLYSEALAALNIIPGECYLDATFGAGGHSSGIIGFGGKVIALEIDQEAIALGAEKFKARQVDGVWITPDSSLKIINKNFKDLSAAADLAKADQFSGILFDLGVSSLMFDSPEKGFSFRLEGPLDMRMDQNLSVTAADLVNGLSEKELNELFTKLGEVSRSRLYARAIVRRRLEEKIKTTKQLAEVVHSVTPNRQGETDSATEVFMALRIAVNDELNNLKVALPQAICRLKKGGRLVVISFHSLEDRIVKEFFRQSSDLEVVTPKPVIASESELEVNRRARSAKMRVAEKI